MTPYSDRVRAYFAAPAHAGEVEQGEVVNVADQDVRLRLSAVVAAGAVDAMRFRAWGCPHTIAAAEAACAGLEGGPAADLLEFSATDLMEELAIPATKTGRILVVEDAVRLLGQAIGGDP